MFFLFGWGRRTRKDFGPTLPLKCGNCNNNGFHRLLHVKTWFTLFFAPVIPYESHHYLLCDVCSRGFELHGSQIDKAKQMNQATTAYLSSKQLKSNTEWRCTRPVCWNTSNLAVSSYVSTPWPHAADAIR